MTKILSLTLRANTPGFEKSAGKVATFAMRTPVDFIVNSSYQPGIIQEVAFVGGAVKFKALASQDLKDRGLDPYYQLTINGKTYTFWVPRDTEDIFIGDTSDTDNLPGDLVRLLTLVPPSGGGNAAPPNVDTTPGNKGPDGDKGPPGNKGPTGDKGADGNAGIITANDISDASAVGKTLIKASDEAAVRAAIDAVGVADLDDAYDTLQTAIDALISVYDYQCSSAGKPSAGKELDWFTVNRPNWQMTGTIKINARVAPTSDYVFNLYRNDSTTPLYSLTLLAGARVATIPVTTITWAENDVGRVNWSVTDATLSGVEITVFGRLI